MKVKLTVLIIVVNLIFANGLLINKNAVIVTLEQQITQIRKEYENVANQFKICENTYRSMSDEYEMNYPLDVLPVRNSLEPFGMSVLATIEMYMEILKILHINEVIQKPSNVTQLTEFNEQMISEVKNQLKETFENELKNWKNYYDAQQQIIIAAVDKTIGINQLLKSTRDKSKQMSRAKLNESVKIIQSYNKKLTANINQLNVKLQQHLSDGHKKTIPTTCQAAMSKTKASGVYEIKDPSQSGDKTIKVKCENDYDGGGWLLIQRRKDGSVSFDRNWSDYEFGFGEPNGEYWLGLQPLHKITTSQQYELYISLKYSESVTVNLKYDHFTIADKSNNYKLTSLGQFNGNGDDVLSSQLNMAFSTSDRDNDLSNMNCASHKQSGWWYKGSGSGSDYYHDYYNDYDNSYQYHNHFNHFHHNHGFHGHGHHNDGCCGLSLNEYNAATQSYHSHCHGRSINFVQMMIRPKQ